MAPIPDSAYFPSLDKLFEGDKLLISWKTALYTLLRGDEFTNQQESAFDHFFSDPAAVELLAHPFKAFPAPNPQTKSAFETKTSAINVAPSSKTRYNIKEVKEDALWLSKEARIDEVSALRIVLVECQDRPSAQLLGQLSNEEVVSIQEAARISQLATALLPQNENPSTIQEDFDSQLSRRIRILRTYLSERRNLLQCLNIICQKSLYPGPDGPDSDKGKDSANPLSWVQAVSQNVLQKTADRDKWIVEAISAIRVVAGNIDGGSGWFQADGGRDDLEREWAHNQITEISHTMEVIFQFVDSRSNICSSAVVIAWLEAMKQYGFFDQSPAEDPVTEALYMPVKSAVTLISLAILAPGSCIEWLRNGEDDPRVSPDASQDLPYPLNLRTLLYIHTTLMGVSDEMCTNAAPMVLAWADILQTLSIRVTEKAVPFEQDAPDEASFGDIFEATLNEMLEILPAEAVDVIQYLASSAVDRGCVFQSLTDLGLRLGGTSNSCFSAIIGARMRIAILDLIRSSSAVGYIPEIVEASLAALTGGRTYWDVLDTQQLRTEDDPLAVLLESHDILEFILGSAKHRFPFESALVKLTRPLATLYDGSGPSLIHQIGTMHTFTCSLPDGFDGYDTTQEEENNNSIRLTVPLHLFEDGVRTRRLQASPSALIPIDDDFVIPSGTYGRMILESPKVAYWEHRYSGLKYFGKLLETFLAAGDVMDAITGVPADRDTVADIIGTIAGLLLGNQKAADVSPDSAANLKVDAYRHLEIAGSGLGQNRDIVTVIFDIFEEELQRQSTSFGSDVSLEVLISCVQFIHGLLPLLPNRVWPLLARSGLLELGRGGGRLTTIVRSIELVSGHFDFLLACTRLFEGIVDDFMSKAVQRRKDEKSFARFGNEEESSGTGVPEQILSKVLLSFTRYFGDVLESSSTWKYALQDDRRRLSRTVTKTFDRILRYAYGIDSKAKPTADTGSHPDDRVLVKLIPNDQARMDANKKPKPPIMAALLPAASHLVDSFLSTSSGALRFQPLLETLHDGLQNHPSTSFLNELDLCIDQVNAVLSFSTTLLRVGILLERPRSQLESQLFKSSPIVSRLYAVNESYRHSVVSLFEALIVSASKDSAEPPSILGYLGTQTSKNFLQVLSDLDAPLRREFCTTSIWQFMAMVVSNRQPWLANYLLTGRSSKNMLKNAGSGKDLAAVDRSPLNTALDALSRIGTLPKSDALAMLDFVALAQNFWPWATYDSAKHAAFIKSISEYVGTLKPIQPSSKLDDSVDAGRQTRIAAYVAEILAMHLFHSRQMGNKIAAKDLLPNLSYFTRFAVAVPSYNSSLHGNLKRNFEARYPGCSILDFERTTLEPRPLGREYFYNYPLLNKALRFDKNWRRPDGLGTEVINANVNLSLVDAQIALLHGWSFLAIELSSDLSNELDLQKTLIKVSMDCLISNKRSQGLEEIFQRLNQRRAELALILMQRLIESNTDRKDMGGLLAVVWETIQNSDPSFGRALLGGNAEYYRTLLKVLFLALRVHADSITPDFKDSTRMRESSTVTPLVMEILESVVANGIRDLATFIHDKPAEANPEDVALVTGKSYDSDSRFFRCRNAFSGCCRSYLINRGSKSAFGVFVVNTMSANYPLICILQACLRVSGIEFYYVQIVNMFSVNDSARVAMTLYSWSDSLAIDGDPIYGELSILFLLELSTIPPMAEQLAIDGVLGQISAANITAYLRRGVVNPFVNSAGIQRCYNIWVRGILPLLLNLLDAVGSSIGTEVAIFVNQFPNLLKQACEAFDTPENSRTVNRNMLKHVNLRSCSEVHSLSLIIYILAGFRQGDGGAMDIPEVKWDISNILEGVEFWLGSRPLLKERILPMGEMAALAKQDNSAFRTRLEEKVVDELLGIRDVLSELTNGGA